MPGMSDVHGEAIQTSQVLIAGVLMGKQKFNLYVCQGIYDFPQVESVGSSSYRRSGRKEEAQQKKRVLYFRQTSEELFGPDRLSPLNSSVSPQWDMHSSPI